MDALISIHNEHFDPAVNLVRMPVGVTPEHDLTTLNLHLVRESLLGAWLDCSLGNFNRAEAAITAVLELQLRHEGAIWHGTFPVTAEQPTPPVEGAVEWVDYDPNWRQFLGVIQALILERFRNQFDTRTVEAMHQSIVLCVRSEPANRIPSWYTNPNLLHTWLSAYAGVLLESEDLIELAKDRRDVITARFERFGDLDEYNSPTYDGIDLLALALWSTVDPSNELARDGRRLFGEVQRRIMKLRNPQLGVVGGPYIRAYGLDVGSYISLLGMWLHEWGLSGPALPPKLTGETPHIHDLYFWPIIQELASRMPAPEIFFNVLSHEQHFNDITATTYQHQDSVFGIEVGRMSNFARNQYFPFVIHSMDSDGSRHYFGLRPLNDTVIVAASKNPNGSFTIIARGSEVGFDVVTSEDFVDNETDLRIGNTWRLRGNCAIDTFDGLRLRCFMPNEVELHLSRNVVVTP